MKTMAVQGMVVAIISTMGCAAAPADPSTPLADGPTEATAAALSVGNDFTPFGLTGGGGGGMDRTGSAATRPTRRSPGSLGTPEPRSTSLRSSARRSTPAGTSSPTIGLRPGTEAVAATTSRSFARRTSS